MREGEEYRVFDRVFPFIATFINSNTDRERITFMKRLHMQYIEMVVDVAGEMGHHA